jgi:hypothetical protein
MADFVLVHGIWSGARAFEQTSWRRIPFGRSVQKAAYDPEWAYGSLLCRHDVMSDQPAQLLANLVGQK